MNSTNRKIKPEKAPSVPAKSRSQMRFQVARIRYFQEFADRQGLCSSGRESKETVQPQSHSSRCSTFRSYLLLLSESSWLSGQQKNFRSQINNFYWFRVETSFFMTRLGAYSLKDWHWIRK
jgi:hypothetical protein